MDVTKIGNGDRGSGIGDRGTGIGERARGTGKKNENKTQLEL